MINQNQRAYFLWNILVDVALSKKLITYGKA